MPLDGRAEQGCCKELQDHVRERMGDLLLVMTNELQPIAWNTSDES